MSKNDFLMERLHRAERLWNASKMEKLLRAPLKVGLQLATSRLQKVCPRDAVTFFGDKMRVTLPEPVSVSIYRFGLFDAEITRFLCRRLNEGATFIDIGAHYGYFTLLGSLLVGERGIVCCFEPIPRTYDLLRRNTDGRPNVRAYQCALYSESKALKIRDYGVIHSAFNTLFFPRLASEEGMGYEEIDVPGVSLDEFVASNKVEPSLIKVDAEGAEGHVLGGAARVLSEHHPDVILEVGDMDRRNQTEKNITCLTGLGYRVFEIIGGDLKPHLIRPFYPESGNLFFIHPSRWRDANCA